MGCWAWLKTQPSGKSQSLGLGFQPSPAPHDLNLYQRGGHDCNFAPSINLVLNCGNLHCTFIQIFFPQTKHNSLQLLSSMLISNSNTTTKTDGFSEKWTLTKSLFLLHFRIKRNHFALSRPIIPCYQFFWSAQRYFWSKNEWLDRVTQTEL